MQKCFEISLERSSVNYLFLKCFKNSFALLARVIFPLFDIYFFKIRSSFFPKIF